MTHGHTPEQNLEQHDIIIAGGGIAGLTAAVYLARGGRGVTLLEKARDVGGRAASRQLEGFTFNQGAHALYLAGEGVQVMKELSIPYSGALPPLGKGAFVEKDGDLFALPAAPGALLTTPLLAHREKLGLVRVLGRIFTANPRDVADMTLQEWVEAQTSAPAIQDVLYMLSRVATYSHARTELSAEVFVLELQRVLRKNTLYVDGGWQSLVAGLHEAALAAGATVETGTPVAAVNETPAGITVNTGDGRALRGTGVIVATDPQTAARLLPHHEPVRDAAQSAVPVRAALLEVGLRRLPRPDRTYALGLEAPTYFSVHSATADLAPAGGALVHMALYLAPHQEAGPHLQRELARLLDLMQPGWREEVVTRRFLPEMTVVNRLATAAEGGLAGRPGVGLADWLAIAGDWVGAHGWMSDASFSSGREAAQRLLARLPKAAGAGTMASARPAAAGVR